MDNEQQSNYDAKDTYSSYFEYNKILRTWFVAFGIGGPALFLINESIAKKLAAQGELKCVATLFLMGAATQVLGAFINKVANWYVYISCTENMDPNSRMCKLSKWLIEQFWIDITLDVVTIISFGLAVWHLLTIFSVA